MKILFLGDYSNLHATLASQLKELGHTVNVVSDRGVYLGSDADFALIRKPGLIGSFRYLADIIRLLPKLRAYDVVQLINPDFFDLRPGKLKFIFDYLKRNNRSVFLTLAGDDHFFIKASAENVFRFSEISVGTNPTPFAESHPEKIKQWLAPKLAKYTRYVYDNVNGGIAILPEYFIAAEPILKDKLTYIPLPINLENLKFTTPDLSGKLKIMVGIRRGGFRELQKGSLILADTARALEKQYPDRCEAVIVENQPLSVYLKLLSESHIVLDQLYAYSPATNALQTMALGKLSGSGAQPEYYQFIGEPDRGAILSLSPLDNSWKDRLEKIINNPDQLIPISHEARRLVETHHDVRMIATRFLDFWASHHNATTHIR